MDVDAPGSSEPSAPADSAPMEQDTAQSAEADEHAAFWAKADSLGIKPEQMCYYVRHHGSVMVVDPTVHQVYLLRWKTFKKLSLIHI